MALRELARHNTRNLTIAHISDLHFTQDTDFPQIQTNQDGNSFLTRGDAHLRNLINDIAAQKPDILAVTGDIAENPFADKLRNLLVPDTRDPELSRWNDSLSVVFERANQFLHNACIVCDINSTGLFVIPGNHDLRLQGTYSGGFWRRKYQATAAESCFAQVFSGCAGEPDVTILCCRSPEKNGPTIMLRIVCLDSNDRDAYLNFATGAVSQSNLEKIDLLKQTSQLLIDDAVFRIVLVHHHPLPVVPAEALRDKKPPVGIVTKAKNLFTTLTSEQTNVFKNSGTFLLKCLGNDVDLIMHGHQHRTWFSNVQYPARSDKRLLVAGAPSAGVPVDGGYGYCLYELDLTGNIKVTERRTPVNPIGYSSSQPFFLYGNDELRTTRRRHIINQLEGFNIVELGCQYGIATADELIRHLRIYEDGNARMTYTYNNLVPRGRETLAQLPIRTFAQGLFLGLEPPSIRILRDQNAYYQSPEWRFVPTDDRRQIVGNIVFTPELNAKRPVSLEIEFLLCNAFQFVKEYRRAITDPPENQEHHSGRLRALYPKVVKDVILFPQRLAPKGPPLPHVFRKDKPPDIMETEYATNALSHSSERGIFSMSVHEPLPDFDYKLSWELLSEKEINEILYTVEGVEVFEKLSQASPPTELQRTRLTGALESFKSELSNTRAPRIIDDKTEVSLHIAVVASEGYQEQRTVKTTLHRFAHLASVSSGSHTFSPGEGITGQAFRSRAPILFERLGQRGSEFYVKRENQSDVHSILYCVPLPVIPFERAKVPVYGVLSIGSYVERSTLVELKQDHVREFMTDVIMGRLNLKIQKMLLDNGSA